MKIKALINCWQAQSEGPLHGEAFNVHLPISAAAKVYALSEMFPERNPQQIISELLSAALDELEEDFPYVPGKRVTALDDQQDPIYEDIGNTPSFMSLTKKYMKTLVSTPPSSTEQPPTEGT
ncbi:MAG: hypothetical protein C9356_10170 [Oleiphilus sp.]|nr:MAG: hypothetical protein C9356_10170 [Oleiphilus sp.]